MVKKITINNPLEPFLTRPHEKLHLAEISRLLNEPHPTVRQWLNSLEKKGILKKSNQGRLTLYLLNTENPNIVDYLIIAEKNKIIRKCEQWLILGEIVNYVITNFNENVKVLIFGSAAESFNSANDIDMLIVGKQDLKGLSGIAKRLNKNIHPLIVKNLNKVSKALKNEIIKKHILIKGSEDFIRWMIWQQ
jgi:DNA-binding transcriptional ArsR family regulator